MARKPTAKSRLLDALSRWPEYRRMTNGELASALRIQHPMTVSQALSSLGEDGKIRLRSDGSWPAVRVIDVLQPTVPEESPVRNDAWK